jgi:hypothetical protein
VIEQNPEAVKRALRPEEATAYRMPVSRSSHDPDGRTPGMPCTIRRIGR